MSVRAKKTKTLLRSPSSLLHSQKRTLRRERQILKRTNTHTHTHERERERILLAWRLLHFRTSRPWRKEREEKRERERLSETDPPPIFTNDAVENI